MILFIDEGNGYQRSLLYVRINCRRFISSFFSIKISHKVVNSISILWHTNKSEHTTVVSSILDSKVLRQYIIDYFVNSCT